MPTRSLAILLICLTTLTFAQQPTANSHPEDQITQLERDWLAADAKGDSAALRHIIADGFLGSSFNGGLLSKQDIVPEEGAPGGFAGATPGDSTVRVFGDTAVLMGVINLAGPQSKQIRVTLVCQKKLQDWQIIAAQLTHA